MPEPGARTRGRVVPGWVFTGVLLLQLAWIVALPTFGGIDEFDHVYRADAVAHGQLRGSVAAPEGRGQLVEVRPAVLEAASRTCRELPYTRPDDCRAVARLDDGRVLVGSAAASYNPAYYAVTGPLARALDGDAFVLGLRVLTALICAGLIATAAHVVSGWSRGPWPMVALAVGVTPTLLYSTALAAPNGIGYAAACLWWACALAVVTGRTPRWGLLTLASVLLVAVHTLNLLWLPLMTLVVLTLQRREWWAERLRDRRALGAAAVVAATGAACASWVLAADTNSLGSESPEAFSVRASDVVVQQTAWVLQTVAAFPMRNEPAHAFVYPVWLMVLGGLLVHAWRVAERRQRSAGILLLGVWLTVPLALTLVSVDHIGYAWQGRYALPLVLGVPFLAAAALDVRGAPARGSLLSVGLGSLALVHVWCPLALVRSDQRGQWGASLANATSEPVALATVGALALLGVVALARSGQVRRAAAPRAAEEALVAG